MVVVRMEQGLETELALAMDGRMLNFLVWSLVFDWGPSQPLVLNCAKSCHQGENEKLGMVALTCSPRGPQFKVSLGQTGSKFQNSLGGTAECLGEPGTGSKFVSLG